jgi:hypothetical protein
MAVRTKRRWIDLGLDEELLSLARWAALIVLMVLIVLGLEEAPASDPAHAVRAID